MINKNYKLWKYGLNFDECHIGMDTLKLSCYNKTIEVDNKIM